MTSEDQAKIKKAVTELSDSLTRIAAERDLQKSILDEMKEKLDMDKKILRKMAKTYYNDSFDKDLTEHEKFETLYKSIKT